MRFRYEPHEGGDKVAYAPPILDLHDRPLVNAGLVAVDDPRASSLVFTPGCSFSVNADDFPAGYYLAAFCKASHDFVLLNASHPGGAKTVTAPRHRRGEEE
jgi:hypothetical protein